MNFDERPARCLLAAIFFLVLTGCGVKNYPVQGEVAFPDGKPLAGGTVVLEFVHDDPRERKSYPAEVGADGRFKLEAPEGAYRALVAPPDSTTGSVEGSARKWTFDPRFSAFESSGLKYSVTRDAAKNHFKIAITPPP